MFQLRSLTLVQRKTYVVVSCVVVRFQLFLVAMELVLEFLFVQTKKTNLDTNKDEKNGAPNKNQPLSTHPTTAATALRQDHYCCFISQEVMSYFHTRTFACFALLSSFPVITTKPPYPPAFFFLFSFFLFFYFSFFPLSMPTSLTASKQIIIKRTTEKK